MSEITEWNAPAVIDFFSARIAASMEIAVKVVEEAARDNLAEIDDPPWGAGYRNEIVGRMLTSYVEKQDKAVLGHVGVRVGSGKGGSLHGFYIEFGSSTAPAHPWLRPALYDNKDDILKILVE